MSGATDTEVLVVGGGPVGLGLAVELGQRGIRATVLERNERAGRQPRAKTTNVRSMEHMRRWGIAEKLRASAPLPRGYPTDMIFATRLFGHTLARFENAFNGAPARNDLYSEPALWIPQYKVEAALAERAREFPSVSVHTGTKFLGFRHTEAGIEAEAEDVVSGVRSIFRAAYLVGADGARSDVRAGMGVRMQGRHAFARNYNYVIRAPGLWSVARERPAVIYWLVNPDCPGVTGPMDAGDIWYFGFQHRQDLPEPDEAAAKDMMRRAFGRDVEIEILVKDSWAAHSLIAESYRAGRVFLAGDACHLHPPFGGYGMNLGIGDAVDLGWKLAATLRGWGGAGLLDSYQTERRRFHQRVVAEAVENYALLSDSFLRDGLERAGEEGDAARRAAGDLIRAHKAREFYTLGVVLGSTYAGSPVIVPDGSEPPPASVGDYRPSAHPGCLAPHLWLADGRSLYDLFGQGFTLLMAGDGNAEAAAGLQKAAAQAGVPLTVLSLDDPRLRGLYGARLALIRPDQHVAWRGDSPDRPPAEIIDIVRGWLPAGRPAMPAAAQGRPDNRPAQSNPGKDVQPCQTTAESSVSTSAA